ncbi:MAG: Rha family transcriptional regulator [Fusobacteriaceae bacterium]
MKDLVVKIESINNVLVTTSNRVAEELGVEHKNVIRKIDDYVEKFGGSKLSCEFYVESNFQNRGKEYKNYLVTEKGIAQLVGGYSSAVEKAFDLNVAYINEFERMKQEVKQPRAKKLEEKTPHEILADNGFAMKSFFETMELNIPNEIIAHTAIVGTTNQTGYEFNEVKVLLNKVEEEVYHTKSEICKRVGIKANKVNLSLIELGIQIEGSTSMHPFVLTELGTKYGVERSFANGKHQGYEIKLKETAEDYIRENLDKLPMSWVK